jgi:AcrR family transcriptional regulator
MPPKDPSDSQKIGGLSSHDRILLAAKQLFATRGYESTSTVAIARAASSSESQLIKHFGSKEGLLEAIFDQGWELMAAVLPSLQHLASPSARLGALLEMILKTFERDLELKEVMLLEGRRIRKEGHMVMLTGGYLRLVQLVDSLLTEMKAVGELRADVDAQALRSALMGMLEAMMRDQMLAKRVGFPARFTSDEVRKVFRLVLGAFGAAPR